MKLEKILFFDVETVPQTENFNELNEEMAGLWSEKFSQIKKRSPDKYPEESRAEEFFQSTGLFAEFGRIACISIGFIYFIDNEKHFRVKSFFGEDEKKILSDFSDLLNKLQEKDFSLCGHNIKEFDVPYVARRLIIHEMPLPDILKTAKRKPWENPFIDTMDLWKFGDYKHYTPLKLLCATLNIPSPKDNIDGSNVANVFYQEKDLVRIARYCEKDVIATAQVYLKLSGQSILKSENIEKVSL